MMTKADVAHEGLEQRQGQIFIECASFKWVDGAGGDEHARSLAQLTPPKSGRNEKGRKKHERHGNGLRREQGQEELGPSERQNGEGESAGQGASRPSSHPAGSAVYMSDSSDGRRKGDGRTGRM